MNKLLIIICGILLASCSASISSIPLKHKTYLSVPENEIAIAELGESIVTKGEEDYQDAFMIKNAPDVTITLVKYPHSAGEILPLSGETKEWFLYYDKSKLQSTGSLSYISGVAKSKNEPTKIVPFINSVNGFAPREVEGFEAVETTYNNRDCSNCFKKEFVYNGKAGNSVKFIYREYVNNLARAAFTQELQYDLSESKEIGFKGMRAEILEAGNVNIKYKLIKGFE